MSGAKSRIRKVAELDLKFRPRAWAFAEERADDILAHWRRRKAERPALFDGRVLALRADRRGLVYGDEATVPL